MFLNKAIICGNLTRDPELRYVPTTGVPIASFTIATNRVWTDENGEQQQSAEFHPVVVFGKQAEPCSQYLKKGQLCLVEGRLQTRSWEQDQDGVMVRRARTEIIASLVRFGPKKVTAEVEPTGNIEGDPNDDIPF